MSLVDVIASLATGTYQVTREAAGTYDTNGRPAAGTASTLSVVAVVQPATPRELLRLPEGEREGERLSVWTATELQLRDVVAAQGASWQVDAVEWWQAGGFWKALVRRVTAA